MNKVEAAEVLIANGANVDYYGMRYQNALFLAIQRDKPRMVEFLMRKGANHRLVFERNIKSLTPSKEVIATIERHIRWQDRKGLLWMLKEPHLLERTGLGGYRKQILFEVVKFL
jgi:hypothetical protein